MARFSTAGHLRAQSIWCSALVLLLLAKVPCGAEATNQTQTISRNQTSAERIPLNSFRLEPGFRIELVAAEPLISAPVALAFDENNRFFVVERRDGSPGTGPYKGRVRVLSELDEEGRPHTSTVYGDELSAASAIACYGGGVFVATTPEIRFLKDTAGQGAVDVNLVVLYGFGGTNQPLARALLSNFNWGLDNRIHGATAGIGGLILTSNWPGHPISIEGSDFSFDPRMLAVSPETGPAQSGLCFDSRGRKFTSDFGRPLRLAMYESRYTARNPFFAKAPGMLDLINPGAPLYAAAAPSVAGSRTNAGTAGWFQSAQGCVVYRGSAFPTNFSENIFVADPDAHVIHRVVLRDYGIAMTAERPKEERTTEFLASTDSSFRPVQMVNGPDGALYIVDNQDRDERGRIYRIVPEPFKRPKPAELGKAKAEELVATLAAVDGWRRDTAARLLFERHDAAALPLLTNMLANSKNPFARLHALQALAGAGSLQEIHLLRALKDPDPRVREHGVLLAEDWINSKGLSGTTAAQLQSLAADPAPRVRYQLAFTAGEIRGTGKLPVLAAILLRDPANPFVQNAVLSSLTENGAEFFTQLAATAAFRNEPSGLEFLRRIALMVGLQGNLGQVQQVGGFLAASSLPPNQAFALAADLGEGLWRTRSSLAMIDSAGALNRVYVQATACAIDASFPEAVRVDAVRLLGLSPYSFAQNGDWLLLLCNPQPFPALQSAAINALGRYDDPRAITGLLERWRLFSPFLRGQALSAWLGHDSRVPALLQAIEAGKIGAGDLSSTHLNFLRTHRNPAIRQKALRLFGPVPWRRPEMIDRFRSALRISGTTERGRQTFLMRCSGCHQVAGVGQAFGPDLSGAGTKGKERLMTAIVQPNVEVSDDYLTAVLQTKQGENIIGIVCDDQPAAVTLAQAGGAKSVWPRVNIESIERQDWSLMPEAFEQGLSIQDMADVLEFFVNRSR